MPKLFVRWNYRGQGIHKVEPVACPVSESSSEQSDTGLLHFQKNFKRTQFKIFSIICLAKLRITTDKLTCGV